MPWTVEVTGEFESWWNSLSEDERVSIDGMIHVLEAHGTSIGPPYSIAVMEAPEAAALRQLLVPHGGRVICVLYVEFAAQLRVILLTGTTAITGEDTCPPEDIRRAASIYVEYASRRNRH